MAALSRGFVIPRKKKVTNQASSVDDISSAFSELTTNDPPSKNEVSRETSLSIVPKKDAAGQGKTDEAALNDLTTIFSTMGVSKAKSVEHTSIGNERLTCPKVPPLRDYQIHLVNAVNNKLEEARRNNHSSAEKSGKIKNQSRGVLAYLPTGGGKTRVALELTLLEVARGGTVLFVVNRDTLAYQTEAVFIKAPALEGKVGMLCGSASRESTDSDGNSSHVTIATIQTLTQRYLTTSNSNGSVSNATLKKTSGGGKIAAKNKHGTSAPLPKVTLVIIDECHCAVATSYLALAAAYPRVPLLGLTATPYRLDPTEPLAAVFSIAVAGPSVSALVGRGFLVPPVVYGELSPCTQAIAESETTFRRALKLWRRHAAQNATHSEYSSGQSGNSSEKSGVNASSLDAASRLSQGIEGIPRYRNRATIAFCCSVMHSLALVSFLRAKGVRAAHVDGDTSRRDRDAALRQLKIGLLDVVSSVGVLSEGFDEPRVECVLLLRPTQSRGLYIQQVGRGLRTCAPVSPGNTATDGNNDDDTSYDEISTYSSGCGDDDDDEESAAAENAQRLACAARAAAACKTNCIVLDCVGNIGRFGPIVGPGPAYAWEVDDDNDDNAAADSAFSKKQANQRVTPLAQCACGAISHQRLARCAGCGQTLARQPLASSMQGRKAQLESLRAFRAQENVSVLKSKTAVPNAKQTGQESVLGPCNTNTPFEGRVTTKDTAPLFWQQENAKHGLKCSSQRKSNDTGAIAQVPEVAGRKLKGQKKGVERNETNRVEGNGKQKKNASLSPLPR